MYIYNVICLRRYEIFLTQICKNDQLIAEKNCGQFLPALMHKFVLYMEVWYRLTWEKGSEVDRVTNGKLERNLKKNDYTQPFDRFGI